MFKSETEAISRQINHIRISSHSDFAALALSKDNGRLYEWCYASGNANDRYKRMIVRQGKGLPGMALLIGRTLTMDQYISGGEGLKVECPIMLAENLKAAAAIPIRPANKNIGVLMVGNRKACLYSASELQYLQACAGELIPLISKRLRSSHGTI